ncbi:hypothetical protein [Actinokineospora xionganensis]|uniref:hypothetical protein n=1 Tax=Actinokineospora xionganensis TaxID=2684470 RepID=UPI001FEC8D60|nr:hypothetical protein [Actinokineospora xionganensis]
MRLPEIELKKSRYAVFKSARACCSTTDDTSPSHTRCGVAFAWVIRRRDNSPSEMYFSPASRAC